MLSIFPTFVWKIQLTSESHERVNGKILEALYGLNPHLAKIAPCAVWQSNQELYKLDAFSELVSYIDSAARTILGFLKVGYDAVEITGCWANVSASGASHAIHSHPNNFLSGVVTFKHRLGRIR